MRFPLSAPIVRTPYPDDDVDFDSTDGAYSAVQLGAVLPRAAADRRPAEQNQRFEEAQRWFHYIFDPTDTSERDRRRSGTGGPGRSSSDSHETSASTRNPSSCSPRSTELRRSRPTRSAT